MVVGDVDRRLAQAPQQEAEFVHEPVPQRPIQGAQRLVQHEQPRPRRQRPGQGHPLGLAARQRRHGPLSVAGQPDQVEHAADPFGSQRLGHSRHAEPEPDVARHVPVREQDLLLEHEPEAPFVGRHPGEILATPGDRSGHRGLESRHCPQQRRLATTAGAEQYHNLAGSDRQVDAVEHRRPVETDRDAIDGQAAHRSPRTTPEPNRPRDSITSTHAAVSSIINTASAMAWPRRRSPGVPSRRNSASGAVSRSG